MTMQPEELGLPLPEEFTCPLDLRERIKKAGKKVADAMERKGEETEQQESIGLPGLLGGTLPKGEVVVIPAFRFKSKK
jgi:hypothetical protein